MDVQYLNTFIAATRHTIDALIRVPVAPGTPRLRQPDERAHKLFRVSVVFGLSGRGTGLVVLNLSEPLALALASIEIGAPLLAVDDRCLAALRTFAQRIADHARNAAAGVWVTPPTVLMTRDLAARADLPTIALPFDTPAGRFELDVAIREPHSRSGHAA